MERTRFCADYSKSDRTMCTTCNEPVIKNNIRIEIAYTRGKDYYHLQCYQPKLKQGISDTDISNYLSGEEAKTFNDWLSEGNSKYLPIDKPFHVPPQKIKQVDSKPSKIKRAGIEVFKFIHPSKALLTLAFVSKEFYHLTGDGELWQFYCISLYNVTDLSTTWRNLYLDLATRSCFGCNIILKDEDFYRCPLINKPICIKCRYRNPKFKVLNKSRIKDKYYINPNVLNLKFGDGKFRSKSTYKFMLDKALLEYREKNKERVLKENAGKPNFDDFKELVDSIDLTEMIYDTNPDDSLSQNVFYANFKTIFEYIRNRDGGLKAIKDLFNSP